MTTENCGGQGNGINSVLRPPFVPFDEHKATRIYLRNLPHWRQKGATYFVTFRLGDSIPEKALHEMEDNKHRWLAARGVTRDHDVTAKLTYRDRYLYRKYVNRLREGITDSGLGDCFLRRANVLNLVRNRLLECDGSDYHLGDFVIMPNHVHVLLNPIAKELEKCLKGIKGSTAVEANRQLDRSGRFWQPDSYDHIVRSMEQLAAYRDYIADNPNKAGVTLLPDANYRAHWL